VLRAVLPPLITAYVIFVLMVVSAWRRPVARPRAATPWLGPRRRGLIRHVATTTAGGYILFLAIVAVFHAWLGEERDALGNALVEGTLLALAVLALFALSTRIPRRRKRR
jgi:Family of unknown function (DUF6256)